MKNSTFSAQVANNLLTVLQGYSKTIRLLLVMFLTLTVTTNAWGATWEKATSIAAGDVVLLVCESKTMELSSISTTSTKYGIGVSYTTSPAGAYELTVEAGSSTDTYSLKNGSTYLYWSSGNSLATNATKSANSSWSITFNNGNATIKNAKDATRIIGWNASSPRFACYTSSQTAVQLYKKVTAVQTVAVTGVSLNQTSLTLTVGNSETLTATVSPDNATNKTITWSTSNSSVATVINGEVTAVAEGSAIITVTTKDGNKTATCSVTVNPKPKYTVTLVPGSGSVTSTTLTETSAGAGVTLPTPTLDGCDEWSFAGWATSAVATETSSKPATLLTGTYKPTANTTLYAVYQRTEETEGNGGTEDVSRSYTFSEYTAGTQYKENEVHKLDDVLTLTTTQCHFTTELRIYSSDSHNGYVVSNQLPGRIISIGFNAGNKVDDIAVYGSTNGTAWTEVGQVSVTSTSYANYSLSFGETNYTYFKLDVVGSNQVRLKSITITWESTSAGGTITTTYYHSTPDCGGSTPDPDPTYYTITLNPNYPEGKKGTFIDTVGNAVDGDLKISWLGETETTPIAKLYSSISLDGYIFEGWYEITAEGEKNRKNTGTITSDTTFYARWKVPYTVTFKAGTGECDPQSITETTANGITLPTATLEDCGNWVFLGWAENAIASETTTAPASILYGGSTYKPTANITLYAIYKRVEGGGGESATLTFDDTSKRTTRTTNQQVWTENGITLTNNKSESTDTVAAYYNPVRFYKSSEIIIEAPENITQIAATTSGSSYATALKSSVGTEASANESVVTIAPTESNTTYTIRLTGGQVRLSSITVTYGGGPSTSYYYSNPVCGSTPTLTVNPTSLAFGNVTVNSNKEMTFTLTGSDLTANAALALSGTNESMFSVNPTSVTQSAGSIDQTITVTYAPTAAGNHTATLTISSADAESKTVTLSGVGSNPPTWQPATINFEGIIQVACGSTTVLNPADPNNGPATITFNGYDLQDSVKVTASKGFLVSTDKTTAGKYTTELTVNPHKDGNNIGKIQNVYVIAQAPAQSGNYDGTITLTGNDIPGGKQVINVTAEVTCTQYTITWSVSGDETQKTTFYAGGEWTLPENPTFNCNGRVFVGWTDNEIVQPQDIAPNVLYKEQGDFPTIESNITFYAVFAQEGTDDGSGTATVTDVLNREWTEVSGTTYKDWNGKTARSSAVYAGNSAGGKESIQLRSDASKDAAGIITTTSGGKATNITVVWHDETADGRTLNVYGKNSAYSAVADLRDGNKRGTLLGTIVKGTSTSLTINDDYEYIGLCSNSGAMYLTSIAITWATDGEGDGNATTYTSYTTSCADVKAIRIVEPTTKTFNEGDKFVFDGEVWAINSDDTETNVTNSQLVHFVYDMNKVGTQTVKVSYLGFTATYEITINAVEKWQITWNVSGATNTGLSPATVVKGQTIGKLPNPKAIPNGCDGKTFVGWTESNTVNSDGTDITFITSSTVPTQNTTYYAVFATPSGNAGDGDYVKVTEDANDLSGEYLIVYEDSKGSPAAPKAFNGGLGTLDAASNTISVTIDGNTIESTDATDAAKFTITKNGDAYIITSASNYHIGQTSDANGLQSSTSTSYTNTITITEDSANIIGEGGAYLRYNKTSSINNGKETGLRFRYYKSSTYNQQQPIALYKKSGSSASYTDYTTGCQDVTITYYGFTGGYTTNCGGSDLNVITQRVNSSHTIPTCTEITDPTDLGRTFLNLWKDQNGKEHKPGDSFIVTQDITLYAQWKLETTGDIELPADKEDLATTDIVVTGGKTLTIPEGETITINSLTLKGGLLGANSESGYAMPSVVIPDNATLVRKNTTINLDLVVNSDSWYPFAVPFALDKNGNIDYLDPVLKAASTYNTHFAIKTYDGENRAIVGTDQENNWDKVLQTAGLQPGKGYIISALTYPDKDTATIRIPMTVPNEWLTNGEQTTVNEVTRNQVTVTAHAGAAATEHQRHAGWNFVANPYLANFAGTNASGSFINGEIIINKGDYSYSEDEVPYVTIPTYNFAHYYQVKLSEATLSPAYSFFVQVGESGTMTFETAGRQQAPASIAARNAEERPVKMDVDITLSDNHSSDQTGIIISDRYSDAYEIGRDLEKLFGSAYNLSVYTLMADNTPLAFQALAIRSSMQVIPVGYRAPEQGEYTFALNTNTSSIDLLNEQYEQLVLVDYQTGELTNLLIADYTFYSERVQSDSRFALYAVPRQNAPTDLPNVLGNGSETQKVLHNGHLYILHNGSVYNGNGQIVK